MKKFLKRQEKSIQRIALSLVTTFTFQMTYANPVLDKVVTGSATVTSTGATLQIDQLSKDVIIDWKNFNINANETTHFNQPIDGIALNRIDDSQGASQIFGKLTATGKIILVNGAGIHFSATAHVDVGSLIASSADISNANFSKGKYIFDQASPYNGSIINEGHIQVADYGLAALLGTRVENRGVISANLGAVALGSGGQFTLDFNGDGLINFTVDQAIHDPKIKQGIANTGSIYADGGRILISAQSAAGVLDDVINMQGIAQAQTVGQHAGSIFLSGGHVGNVVIDGKLSTANLKDQTTSGSIDISGQHIHLGAHAKINADGLGSAGNISLGGKNTAHQAETINVSSGAMLSASSLQQGNGGQIVLWSKQKTEFAGTALANGGINGGNGGFIETSGHYLNIDHAHISTLASKGKLGRWLLDPSDFEINASNVNSILAALANSDVTITTNNGGDSDYGDFGYGDIVVNASLDWSSASTLSLIADRYIFINDDISAVNGGISLSAVTGAQDETVGTIGSGCLMGPICDSAPTSLTANINLKNFTLLQGHWLQNATTLPTFNVSNDFNIDVSNPVFNQYFSAEFTRFNSTNGLRGIQDIFGLQGIATGSLSASYTLLNNIDASATTFWQGGQGFVPIAFASTDSQEINPYSGNFDGQNFSISNLSETLSGDLYGGLIAINAGVISNVSISGNINVLQDNSYTGREIIGMLVGQNAGTISNANASGSINMNIAGGTGYIGGLVGLNSATVTNSHSNVNVALTVSEDPTVYAGGVIGSNAGSLTNVSATTSGGTGTNLLTVLSTSPNETWNLGNNSGTIVRSDATNTISFNDFQSLTAGASNDNFNFGSSGTLSGALDGGGGTNTITFANPIVINFATGTTNINGVNVAFKNFSTFNGSYSIVFSQGQLTAISAATTTPFGSDAQPAGSGMSLAQANLQNTLLNINLLTTSVSSVNNKMSQGDTSLTNHQKVGKNC